MTSAIVERAQGLKDADQVERFLGEIELARHVALAKLASPTLAPAAADDVLTLTAAAELCGASSRWVRERWKELGGRRIGRKLLFSRQRLLARK